MTDRMMSQEADEKAVTRINAREANADDQPLQASDPRSATVDRGAVDPASPGAAEDEAAAHEQPDA